MISASLRACCSVEYPDLKPYRVSRFSSNSFFILVSIVLSVNFECVFRRLVCL